MSVLVSLGVDLALLGVHPFQLGTGCLQVLRQRLLPLRAVGLSLVCQDQGCRRHPLGAAWGLSLCHSLGQLAEIPFRPLKGTDKGDGISHRKSICHFSAPCRHNNQPRASTASVARVTTGMNGQTERPPARNGQANQASTRAKA